MGIRIVIYAIVPVTSARFENEVLKQLKEYMEELKRAKQEREDIKKEFESVFEEEKKQVEEVERVTGMNYEEAMEKYDMTQIAPSSENLKNHYKRLRKDNEYRKKWKTAVSSKVEEQERKLGKKVIALLNTKTLAYEL